MGLLTNILACIRETTEERAFNLQLRNDGLKIAIEQCLEEINGAIPSKEVAIKFVLQELDFAEKENLFSQEFLTQSGFHPLEYKNALERFKDSQEELLHIQTILDNFLRKIKNEKEMINVSMGLLKKVMYRWEIGKYSLARGEHEEQTIEPHKEEEQEDIEENNTIENIEEPPKTLQYDSKRVNQLMEEYSDIIGDIITGKENPKEKARIEAFKEHITLASIEKESDHAIVLACFYEHKEPYNLNLPIQVSDMSDVSVNFLKSILQGFAKQGFSQSFLKYAEENSQEIYDLTQ